MNTQQVLVRSMPQQAVGTLGSCVLGHLTGTDVSEELVVERSDQAVDHGQIPRSQRAAT